MGTLLKDHNPKKEALVKDRTPPFFFLLRIPLNVKDEDIGQIVGVHSFDLRLRHFRSSTPQYAMASICSKNLICENKHPLAATSTAWLDGAQKRTCPPVPSLLFKATNWRANSTPVRVFPVPERHKQHGTRQCSKKNKQQLDCFSNDDGDRSKKRGTIEEWFLIQIICCANLRAEALRSF